jgi:hypothetical protein
VRREVDGQGGHYAWQPHGSNKDEPDDVTALCIQRRADTEFAGALTNGDRATLV